MIIWLIVLGVALVACAFFARRSKKAIAHDVFVVLVALLPPIIGNLLIMCSGDWLVSRIGMYIYFMGLDLTVAATLRFSTDYCDIPYVGTVRRKLVFAFVAIDVIQLALNPFTGHAFTTTVTMVEGTPYHVLVPLAGQAFHRLVAYGIFFVSLGVFIYKVVKSPRIYVERYLVILLIMVLAGGLETFFIFSQTPVDRSMIAFGVFGLLVYYFALLYKPILLLDRILARVVSDMGESVLFFDRDSTCIYANTAARGLFGITDDSQLEGCPAQVAEAIGVDGLEMRNDWSARKAIGAEGIHQRFWSLDFHTIEDKRGRQVGAFLNIRDRTDEELNLRREKHFATHDRLTGLYNKEHLYDEARRIIDANPNTAYRVVALDVKDFKLVNDIFSKDFGDKVLLAIADHMRNYASSDEVYGRISGDKFGFVLPAGQFHPEDTEEHLHQNTFFEGIDTNNYPILLHMGVYDVTEPELPLSVMFDRAFMAIASIKNDFQRHVAFYDEHMRNDVIWNQKITAQLDEAMESGQIRPYLQPMVDEGGQVIGAEVLVRWIHPEEGFLSPARFIPHFEENGSIARLDAHMWRCACRILKEWEAHGIDLFLSVNISPKDFYFLDVYQTISDLVDEYGIDPRRLRLEITETVMMSDIENRLRIIEDLRGRGFLVEMDDFGSGYSSLNLLKDIPVDVLKIDMMFLYKTKDQQRAHTILQTIINLSERLGIPSVTEGVETVDQLDMLVQMGCRMFQGYYFAKPMPVEDFESEYTARA